MKITTFNPLIVSSKADELVKLFEELGFEKRHEVLNVGGMDVSSARMTDANGFHVDVAKAEMLPQDMSLIRVNVDDFDEAYKLLTSHGFTAPSGNVVESSSAKSVRLASPSGFAIVLCQHIKKDS